MQSKIPEVVIIGAGFGGVYTARHLARLAKAGQIKLTIISREGYFLFTPLLHEVATGGLSPRSIVEPLAEIFRGNNFDVVKAEVREVDFEQQLVKVDSNSYSYDYLVLATGGENNFYGIPGLAENTIGLKTLSDAVYLRNTIISFIKGGKKDLVFTVIGGGATGVELVAELIELVKEAGREFDTTNIKVCLIAGGDNLIPQFPQKVRQVATNILRQKGVEIIFKQKVVEMDNNTIILDDDSRLWSDLTVWTGGIKPASTQFSSLSKNEGGRILTNNFLHLNNRPEVYILGDVSVIDESPLPMLAQVAVQQGLLVAKNIAANIRGVKPKPFVYHSKGILLSLGHGKAVGYLGGLVFSGWFMWWLWRTVYLFNFISPRKRLRIASEWTINLFYPRDISCLENI